MNIQIKVKRKAYKQLATLPDDYKRRILGKIEGLKQWPDCNNVKALKNSDNYRLRVGRYRVIFKVSATQNPVIIRIEEVKKRDDRTYSH